MDESTVVSGSIPSSSVSLNLGYLKTAEGILKIIQFLFGLVTWALAASMGGLCDVGAFQFMMFVGVTSWILTTFFLIIFLFGINSGAGSSLPWHLIEFCFNAFWGLFYFVASCVQSAYICGYGNLVGASIISYIVSLAYIIHASLSFRSWKGHFPFQGGQQPSNVDSYA